MKLHGALALLLAAPVACGGEGAAPSDSGVFPDVLEIPPAQDAAVDAGTNTSTSADATVADASSIDAGAMDAGTATVARFRVRIENVSGSSQLPTTLSRAAWAVHTGPNPMFVLDGRDRGKGLEQLAEEGDLAELVRTLPSVDRDTVSVGVLERPMSKPIEPGESAEATISVPRALGATARFSLVTGVGALNDTFLSTSTAGIDLFDAMGRPKGGTLSVGLFESGTEADEAPTGGPNQGRTQAAPNSGPAEGVVHRQVHGTRGLPLPAGIADLSVSIRGSDLVVAVQNVSAQRGAISTSISGIFWAAHAEGWRFFDPGQAASAALRAFATTSSGDMLTTTARADMRVAAAGVAGTKASPGQRLEVVARPTAARPFLTLAFGISETNDAFVAPRAAVRAVGADGRFRPVADIERELTDALAVWDAGVERNEAPGIGPNQPPRQSAGMASTPDPVPNVHLYADTANDMAGARAGGIARVTVSSSGGGMFSVTFENTSGTSAYPTRLSPMVFMVHDGRLQLFRDGTRAAAQLGTLAADALGAPLKNRLSMEMNVVAGLVDRSDDGTLGPIEPGDSYSVTVQASAAQPFLTLVSGVLASNDTFLSLGPTGVRLVDANGVPRSAQALAMDLDTALEAWDAGVEGNQSGGAGPDQPDRQSGPGVGPAEGNGLVRRYEGAPWRLPSGSKLATVTIAPE